MGVYFFHANSIYFLILWNKKKAFYVYFPPVHARPIRTLQIGESLVYTKNKWHLDLRKYKTSSKYRPQITELHNELVSWMHIYFCSLHTLSSIFTNPNPTPYPSPFIFFFSLLFSFISDWIVWINIEKKTKINKSIRLHQSTSTSKSIASICWMMKKIMTTW